MKPLALFLLCLLPVWSGTRITDTLYTAGGRFNGTIQITAPAMTVAGRTVVASQVQLPVQNGVLDIELEPNIGAVPAGTAYQVRLVSRDGSNRTEFWVVPASVTPVTVAAVRSPIIPTPSAIVNLSQLGGAQGQSGKPLCSDGAGWVPGACTASPADWVTLLNKPSTFPSDWSTLANKPATFPAAWSSVTGKPGTYPSTIAEVAGLQAALDGKLAVGDRGVAGGVAGLGPDGKLAGAIYPALIPANISGNAATATALAADGSDCVPGQAARGVDAQGNATGCFAPASPLPTSAKGDLVVHNGSTNVRLPAGPDGQALIADSTQPTGLRYASVGGTGTVTSVGVSVPPWLTVANSPIVGSGILAVTATPGLTANQVLATPDGTTGPLAPRVLTANDIPTLPGTKISGNITGNAAGVTAIVPLSLGGTAANLSATGGAGQYLRQTTAGGPVTVGTIPYADLTGVPTLRYQTVQVGGVAQPQQAALDLVAGTNVTLTPVNDTANNRTRVTISATGGSGSLQISDGISTWTQPRLVITGGGAGVTNNTALGQVELSIPGAQNTILAGSGGGAKSPVGGLDVTSPWLTTTTFGGEIRYILNALTVRVNGTLNGNAGEVTELNLGANLAVTGTGSTRTITATAGGSGAPATATYITQTPDATLSGEQALSTLGNGLLRNTTGTGVLSIAAADTDYVTPNGIGLLQNKTLINPRISLGSDALGDLYTRNGSGQLIRVPIGTDGQVLTVVAGMPGWAAGGGSVANLTAFSTGLRAGPGPGNPNATDTLLVESRTTDDTLLRIKMRAGQPWENHFFLAEKENGDWAVRMRIDGGNGALDVTGRVSWERGLANVSGVRVGADAALGWGLTNNPFDGADLELRRVAAAVLRATNGSTGTARVQAESLQLDPVAAVKPVCSVSTRFTIWVTPGGTGVADLKEVCVKNAANVYGWVAF